MSKAQRPIDDADENVIRTQGRELDNLSNAVRRNFNYGSIPHIFVTVANSTARDAYFAALDSNTFGLAVGSAVISPTLGVGQIVIATMTLVAPGVTQGSIVMRYLPETRDAAGLVTVLGSWAALANGLP